MGVTTDPVARVVGDDVDADADCAAAPTTAPVVAVVADVEDAAAAADDDAIASFARASAADRSMHSTRLRTAS